MIFVTAGTQFPFDRMIKAIDELAPELDQEIIAQALPGKYIPKNFKLNALIPADEFSKLVAESSLLVAHAGIGAIISAMLKSKRLIVMPRSGDMGEHRNNHQIDTAHRFEELGYINVAWDETMLKSMIKNPPQTSLKPIGNEASKELIACVNDFILGAQP